MHASGKVWGLALIAAGVLLIWPLWVTGTPGMPDYPAHLASYYLIGGAARTAPLSHFYGIAWAPIPNLAGEAVIPVLAKVLPLDTAARVFLGAALFMWVAGPALIHRALYGRFGPAPFAASLFAYNVNFMWGFVNYYFATGLCLLVFAAWIGGASRPRAARLASFAAALTLVYFCHIVAAGLLALLIATYEAAQARQGETVSWSELRARLARVAAICAPGVLLFLLKPGAGVGGGVQFNLLGTLPARILGAIQEGFASPAYLPLGLVAVLFVLGLRRGVVVVHRRMRLTLAVLAVAALCAPESVMGGWGLHLRFPPVVGALLLASCRITLPPRAVVALGAAVLAALGWMSSSVAGQWTDVDRHVNGFRAALRDLPRGSRLMTAVDPDARRRIEPKLYWHMAEFAIIDRGAFTSLMFATKGQHVVYLRPALAPFAAQTAAQGTPPDLDELRALAPMHAAPGRRFKPEHAYLLNFRCHYDEVVLIHGAAGPEAVPDFLRLRRRGGVYSLYDITRPSWCPSQASMAGTNGAVRNGHTVGAARRYAAWRGRRGG